jgi:hypothetical protein
MRRLVVLLSVHGLLMASCVSTIDQNEEADYHGQDPDEGGMLPRAVTTVESAVSGGCSTSLVIGLSRQIADEVVCMLPAGSFVAFAEENGITFSGSAVLPYLAPEALDDLRRAVRNGASLQVTSGYRTVVQQYLLYRWANQGRCGISVAARPGNSNHESGRAIDVSNYSSVRAKLEAVGWDQLAGDPVHFDHADSPDLRGSDIKAFQRLWNRNHPGDRIAEDGKYGPQTEARLKQSPAAGFATGSCATPAPEPEPEPEPQPEPPPDDPPAGSYTPYGGTESSWSCSGLTGKRAPADQSLYVTSFGCWTDSSGRVHGDGSDNCEPACRTAAGSYGSSTAEFNQLCGGLTGRQCEQKVNWYVADADRFGCMTRLRVTRPSTGKSVIVVVLDRGPACSVEAQVGHWGLDVSYPVSNYLFGESSAITEKRAVTVEIVPKSTPLGPE